MRVISRMKLQCHSKSDIYHLKQGNGVAYVLTRKSESQTRTQGCPKEGHYSSSLTSIRLRWIVNVKGCFLSFVTYWNFSSFNILIKIYVYADSNWADIRSVPTDASLFISVSSQNHKIRGFCYRVLLSNCDNIPYFWRKN